MIAANAEIGVARAAYFPTITLGAEGGFEGSAASNWLSAPSSFWAIGPSALLTVLDGGLRRAQVAQARAQFDASAANYRNVVVTAFQQVEDSLALLNRYHDASVEEKAAVEAAQRSLNFSLVLYVKGATDYLTVVTSQTALLQTQLEALNLDTMQLSASVNLIRALGGGWERRVHAPGQGPADLRASRGRRATSLPRNEEKSMTQRDRNPTRLAISVLFGCTLSAMSAYAQQAKLDATPPDPNADSAAATKVMTEHQGMWKWVVPPVKMQGMFDDHDPNWARCGKLIPTNCRSQLD